MVGIAGGGNRRPGGRRHQLSLAGHYGARPGLLIATWALVTGVLEIIAAVRLRKEIEGEWLLALSGIFSILLGGLLAIMPGPGAVALVWYLGAYAVAFGVLLIALGFRLRARHEKRKSQSHLAA